MLYLCAANGISKLIYFLCVAHNVGEMVFCFLLLIAILGSVCLCVAHW